MRSAATPEPQKERKPDFEIIGDLSAEYDGFALYITGTIKNNKGRTLSYAQVTINLYDADGNQVGTALDNIAILKRTEHGNLVPIPWRTVK
ncbi:FxLYD domain-containing protein [Thermoclostridium caenicola]|uniref:FxLYD domain-containing protein n=1 Tax=Thermoclostridium caenicola TaxID=659425 RepID=UPI003D811D5D